MMIHKTRNRVGGKGVRRLFGTVGATLTMVVWPHRDGRRDHAEQNSHPTRRDPLGSGAASAIDSAVGAPVRG
jgi:hypothetical protein